MLWFGCLARLAFSGAWAVASAHHLRIMFGLLAMVCGGCPQQRGPLRSAIVQSCARPLPWSLSHRKPCASISRTAVCAPERVNHETALNKDVCDRSASELAWSCVAEMAEKTKKCRYCDQAYSGGPVRIKAHILSSCSNMVVEVLTDEFRAPAAPRAMMQLQLGGGIPRPRAPIT